MMMPTPYLPPPHISTRNDAPVPLDEEMAALSDEALESWSRHIRALSSQRGLSFADSLHELIRVAREVWRRKEQRAAHTSH
jgi:hypothetical protein